jgi:hypothetical protein
MESSTKTNSGAKPVSMAIQKILSTDIQELEQALQIDLEGTARQTRALVRRREIRSAIDLLRLLLMYVMNDWSLKMVAAWALLQEIGYLSDVAVLKRVRGCLAWLQMLISLILQRRCQLLQETTPVRLRLMDASVITGPGSKGTDWRLHLGLTLWPLAIDGVEITDAQGGETLARFAPQPDEIRMADRGYAFTSGLAPILAGEGFLVLRINWQNLPLMTETGERFGLMAWLKTLKAPGEQAVWLHTPKGRFALRLLAGPLPKEVGERAEQHARKNNRKKKRKASPNTLLAAHFLLLVTNLPAADWPVWKVLWLYRLRWQIELAIKRLKSLIQIDHLRTQDPRMVQIYLLSKIFVALMVDELIQQVDNCQPEWSLSLDHPLSIWRLTQFLKDRLQQWIFGRLDWKRFFLCLPALRRYFCDSPRARPQQLAWARAFLDFQTGSFSLFRC